MKDVDVRFTGSVPANYERYMVPLLFRPYAELLAQRAAQLRPRSILETAAGTGVVTDALTQALPDAQIVATDLNQAMLDVAATRVNSPNVSLRQADALDLPFDDGSFDLVVCQFGVMFFPDKVMGNVEARRVLRDGGHYLLAIWDTVERNLATRIAGAAVAELFPDEPAAFYERIPFRYHDRQQIEADLRAAGFAEVRIDTVTLVSRAASARDAAIGLTQGTPMRSEIEKRGPEALAAATDAAEAALSQFEGPNGFEAPMAAHIVTATR